MESKYQYRLSQKAEADLDGIVSYISVELSNPQEADWQLYHVLSSC